MRLPPGATDSAEMAMHSAAEGPQTEKEKTESVNDFVPAEFVSAEYVPAESAAYTHVSAAAGGRRGSMWDYEKENYTETSMKERIEAQLQVFVCVYVRVCMRARAQVVFAGGAERGECMGW